MEATEFDASLGGTEHLPYAANSLKFAASRSVEIAAMTESILRPSKTKLIFQSLPIHMRRRVMSHNCKRLPRKLRSGHLEQLKKSGLPPKQKRPSRKYRRRPANLLEEYNRRQKRNVWLETHIWHAKRFHMIERWGHRLPYAPCDKAFRACYRGSSAHCLMQDISYYVPIQIMGTIEDIKNMFSKITSCSCGLSITAKAYIKGSRYGTAHMYRTNCFPFGYVGKVEFIWTPNDTSSRILWLFVHPSQAKELEAVLKNASTDNDDEYETAKKRRKLTSSSSNIQIKPAASTFNRFRLTGPNSHAILVQSLKCIDDGVKNDKWMGLHKPLHLADKGEYWQSINTVSSPSQLPPNIVIGLVVKDPRLSRPLRRTKAKQNLTSVMDTSTLLKVPSFLSNSPLWDISIHETIKKDRMTNGEFVKHVSKTQIVPGEVNEDDPALQSVPIVLLQRPGSQDSNFKKIGYGNGWDIIMPPGYALPFWLTFIMFGARSGGLREAVNVAFEMAECYYSPDSTAGKENEKHVELELRNKYFRLPPSKRVNYVKIAVNSPFICPWNLLLSDWSGSKIEDFFVLRDRTLLNNLQDCIMRKMKLPHFNNAASCLVPVYIKLTGKGNLKNHCMICMPEPDDIAKIQTLYEPLHEDPNEIIRKVKRSEHRKLLKKLKRKNMKMKKKTRISDRKPKKEEPQEPSEYVKSMRELWLPSKIESVRHIASRQTMGYIIHGAFSFTEACSCGIGYVAYDALKNLLNNSHNQILVRNTSSRKYRLANISIIKNI